VISVASICEGDAVILNGTVGDHGSAVLHEREELDLSSDIVSDSAPLNGLVSNILSACRHIHCMRDATRGGLGGILAEIAGQSQNSIVIDENAIPLRDDVRGICEILGFDPLYLANEGKMVVFCPQEDAAAVLDVMKRHEYGRNSAVIGSVKEKGAGRLVMRTVIGGERVLDIPSGELVPRIC
jgi:hydrogenase expression/formation protein HypE